LPPRFEFSGVSDYRSLQPQDNRAAVSIWCTVVSVAILGIAFAFHQTQGVNQSSTSSVSDGSTEAQWNKYHQSLQQAKQEQTPQQVYGSEEVVIEWMMSY
jgi:hypothetical protein